MKRFLFRAALFVLLGLPLALVLNYLSMQYPPDFLALRSFERIEAVLENAEAVEMLAVGNSHAWAIDFSVIDEDGYNIGLPWSDAQEVEHTVRSLVPRFPQLRTVFIAVSYFTFHWDNDHASNPSYLESRQILYATLAERRWLEGDFSNYLRGRAYLVGRHDGWPKMLATALGRDPHAEIRQRWQRSRVRGSTDSVLSDHARGRVNLFIRAKREMLRADPELPERNYAALSSTIAFLQERGIRVILFTPPYSRPYQVHYEQESRTLAEMNRLLHRLQTEHEVEWYDFSHHEIARVPTYFADSDHLSFQGKREFTRQLEQAVASVRPLRD